MSELAMKFRHFRFLSGEGPTDGMLTAIMRDAAEEAVFLNPPRGQILLAGSGGAAETPLHTTH